MNEKRKPDLLTTFITFLIVASISVVIFFAINAIIKNQSGEKTQEQIKLESHIENYPEQIQNFFNSVPKLVACSDMVNIVKDKQGKTIPTPIAYELWEGKLYLRDCTLQFIHNGELVEMKIEKPVIIFEYPVERK